MDKKTFVKEVVAGIFFLLCLGVIVAAVFTIGSERGLTKPKFQMTIIFKRVGGLNIGAPVNLSGVTVGTVEDINFLEKEVDGRAVEVTLTIYKKYESQLHKSKSFAINTKGVLGEKIVDITTEPGFFREDLSQPIIGEDPLDVLDLADTLGDAAGSLAETSRAIDGLVKEMQRISIATKRLLMRIEQRVIDGNLFKVF